MRLEANVILVLLRIFLSRYFNFSVYFCMNMLIDMYQCAPSMLSRKRLFVFPLVSLQKLLKIVRSICDSFYSELYGSQIYMYAEMFHTYAC